MTTPPPRTQREGFSRVKALLEGLSELGFEAGRDVSSGAGPAAALGGVASCPTKESRHPLTTGREAKVPRLDTAPARTPCTARPHRHLGLP